MENTTTDDTATGKTTTQTTTTETTISEGGAAGGGLTVTGTVVSPKSPNRKSPNTTVKKVIVAVHGVGDQYKYATIQSVVNQFCSFYQQPSAIPLGNFHNDESAFTISEPYPSEPFERFAFAEVYWAEIPRKLVDDRHKLEEAKKWARTIVERLRLRWREHWRGINDDNNDRGGYTEADFVLLGQVLTEMIETIAVIDWLCSLAARAGVFTFDVRKLFEDYLGDVQVVTEFTQHRKEILAAFGEIMGRVPDDFPSADIYIIAHSEGTVVSFIGLLEAFRAEDLPSWARRVRGFMTFGSPIDKHLMLWPGIFKPAQKRDEPAPPKHLLDTPIEWHNYYDFGDPIGFALDDARAWIRENRWEKVFNFPEKPSHDHGFARYPFPGKAHVDYWNDETIFRHFIEAVVNREPPDQEGEPEPSSDIGDPPGDIPGRQFLIYVVPYLGVVALLAVASYVIFKAVIGAIDPNEEMVPKTIDIARGVAGITGLLLGMTVVARVPRLTRNLHWRGGAVAFGLLSAYSYLWSVQDREPTAMLGFSFPAGVVTVMMAAVIVFVVFCLSIYRPSWGLKPLIVLGTLAAAVKVMVTLLKENAAVGEIWPLFLAMVGFLYLWWLAALLFDLIFVWHLYIRHSKMLMRMDEMMGGSRCEPAAQEAASKERAGKTSLPKG